ncbi:MAG: Peptidase M16 domain protein [Parcubacteria group bacterium GW2011_GWF2_38_76]|nr:MAG: Peptidase M16 domain protein [Parcubacteria group bacterium GW2011_GWF2_38_76]HBM45669.1 hypothetical protein [Patescibacteria group bacterium]
MGKIKQTVRQDGLRIITKKLTYTQKVMFSVTSLMGSANDSEESLGLAHYFEHMVFQGTKNRDKDELERLLALYCITHNADTSHLRTRYYGESAKINYKKMVEVILDMYCNPIFPEDRIENERGVINNEIIMRHSSDDITVSENIITALYGDKSLAGRGVIGSKETIATVNREVLLKMHKEYYSPANSVIVVTGDVSHSEVVKMVNRFFPRIVGNYKSQKIEWNNDSCSLPSSQIIQEERPGRECALLCLGVKLKNFDFKERVILSILVKYFRKIVFDELRQKRGLVYTAGAYLNSERPLYNTFCLYAETAVANLDEIKKLMTEIILNKVCLEKYIEDIKQRILAESSVSLETTGDWNRAILGRVVLGEDDVSSLDNYFKNISEALNSIDLGMVERIFYENLNHKDNLAFSIVTNKI